METSKFDIADYLDSKEMIAEYLNTVLEEGNNTDVINAWIIRFVLCHPFRSYSARHFGPDRANIYGSICAT